MTNALVDPIVAPSEDMPWLSEVPSRCEALLPDWYRELQARSWRNFLDLPVPVRGNEAWRFSNLKMLDFGGFTLAGPAPDGPDFVGIDKASARFVFRNNELSEREGPRLPDGVICLPLREALTIHGDLVRKHLMQESPRLGGERFAALHGAADLSGLFVYVPRGVELRETIEVFHVAGGAKSAVFPHTLIVAEPQSKVSVLDHFESIDEQEALFVGMNDLIAKPNSKLEYIALQDTNASTRVVLLNSIRVEKDAHALACQINLGGMWARSESFSRLEGPGARSDMLSANLATGDEEYDQRTLQLHEAGQTHSDLLYKNALYDRARTIFSGLIKVEEGAHGTDAYQSCRNLLGAETVEATAMPGLEIDADQVSCSHGSTSAPISEEEMFYLRARGLDAVRARKMISFGFLNEVLERLSGECVREYLAERLQQHFAKVG